MCEVWKADVRQMSATVYPGRDVRGFYNCNLKLIFISCPREQHPWMSTAPQLKHTNPAYAERVPPAYFQFQLRPCGARMPPVGSSWDRGGATRPADGGDHASLSGPHHSGRIQRLRDSWAKNLKVWNCHTDGAVITWTYLRRDYLR